MPVSRRLRRLLRDMFVVVASILVAFALDAWWDWRNDRRDEKEKLLGLQSEFSAIAEQVGGQARKHAGIAAATDSLLMLTGPEPSPAATAEHVQRLLAAAFIPSTLDVSSGTLNALLAGGRLELIRSAELRRALAAWDGVLRDATEDEANARDQVLETLVPLLAEDTRLRARFQLDTTTRPQSRFTPAHRGLLTDPRVAAALDFRAYWLRHVVAELEEVEIEARRIVGLVEAELQR